MYNFSEDEICYQVLQKMRELGIFPKDENVILDGKLHRYVVEGDKGSDKNGAYCIHIDGVPAGFLQDWKTGVKTNWRFETENFNSQTVENKISKVEIEKKRVERDKKLKEKQLKATELARAFFAQLEKEPYNHPYLIKKQVKSYDLRLISSSNTLAVPLKDIDGDIVTLQYIDQEGGKKFFPGAPVKGSFWSIALDLLKGDKSDILLLGEGFATMAKVYELTNYPCVAAMNCGKLSEVSKILKSKYPKATIIIMADDDRENEIKRGNNPGVDMARQCVDEKTVKAFLVPPFKDFHDGTDWNDFSIKYGDQITKDILNWRISFLCMTPFRQKALLQVEQINAQTLRTKEFEPVKWAVEGFLPAGLSILAGSPKVGKSILSLHLGLAVAIGSCALGKIPVTQGDVLYLALEDTQRRLKERINSSDIPENCDLSRLTLATRVPRQHEGGIEYLRWWLEIHKHARLIIIDTLQKFRKLLSGKNSMYTEDYDAISEIKKIADEFNVAILIIHHLKKAMAEDWINEISGSQGISGAADTIFALKRPRNENLGTLHRTGRDVEEKTFTIQLDQFGWFLREDMDISDSQEAKWQNRIIEFLKEHKNISPMILSQVFNIPTNTAQTQLGRLAKKGILKKEGFGLYFLA